MWDILLTTEDAVKSLAGNILTTKSVRLQTEYMGIRKTVALYITADHLRFSFAKFGEVADVWFVKSKADIATGDFEIMATLSGKNFMDIPNVLICAGRPICVVVDLTGGFVVPQDIIRNLTLERSQHHNPNNIQAGKHQ